MVTIAIDETRERRIAEEILADTESDEERATAWYHYLDGQITFPFQALFEGDEEVEVVSMAVEEDCLDEMKMEVRYSDSFGEEPFTALAVDLEPLDADDSSTEAVEDWQYWWERGNRLNEPETDPVADFSDDDLDDVDDEDVDVDVDLDGEEE
ncbi:MAG: calcium-binding protein [Synechococcales cyanobacterium RM1_1_8]|nr:calcium-binding protein [Synechococcales cyanobacterium RM1_1_8]